MSFSSWISPELMIWKWVKSASNCPSVSLIVVIVFRRTGETVSVSGLSDETVSVFVRVDNSLLLFSPLFDEGMSSSPTN